MKHLREPRREPIGQKQHKKHHNKPQKDPCPEVTLKDILEHQKEISRQLVEMESRLDGRINKIIERMNTMVNTLESNLEGVKKNGTIIGSMAELLRILTKMIKEAPGAGFTPAQQKIIDDTAAEILKNDEAAAAALLENTPGEVIPPDATLGLTELSPASASAGASDFELTVTGVGFKDGAKVRFNGSEVETTFVSETELTANVPADLIANAGEVAVTVVNPGNEVASNSLAITINA